MGDKWKIKGVKTQKVGQGDLAVAYLGEKMAMLFQMACRSTQCEELKFFVAVWRPN